MTQIRYKGEVYEAEELRAGDAVYWHIRSLQETVLDCAVAVVGQPKYSPDNPPPPPPSSDHLTPEPSDRATAPTNKKKTRKVDEDA